MSAVGVDICHDITRRIVFHEREGTLFLVAALAPTMVERGQVPSSMSTRCPFRHGRHALYGSSKAALELLTKAWATEFGPQGIRVNTVSPGPTRTEGTAGMGSALDETRRRRPRRSAGQPGGDRLGHRLPGKRQASFIHGVVLAVDGGRTAT
jgi:NAD(P)-dependent dehydrogenase (short-subunit alcohol dehydrogenase family)